MSISSTDSFLNLLREHHLLEPAQLKELTQSLPKQFLDPRALAKELVKRGWLTPYQVNHLFKGDVANLTLGPYVLLERIGEGGMGQVFKARHRKLDRIVALKLIRKDRLSGATAIERFQREAKAAARLAHPNIVAIYDADEIHGSHFLSMEYVEGTDLAHLVKQRGPLPVGEACEYIRQAAVGLQHAHERGLVHRDIKPHNLLVAHSAPGSAGGLGATINPPAEPGANGVVKILDMGLARLRQLEEEKALTQEGSIMGTPDYLAPEQAQDAHTADIRADLYSLGCTFYFLLAGRPPFPGGSAFEKLIKHQSQEPELLDKFRTDLPPEVVAIVKRLLAKKPAERYQTPGELAEALEPFCAQPHHSAARLTAVPVHSDTLSDLKGTPTQDYPKTVNLAKRRRMLTISVGATVLVLGVIALVLFLAFNPPVPEPTPKGEGGAETNPPPVKGGEPMSRASLVQSPSPLPGVRSWTLETVSHRGQVRGLAFSPDGRQLATGDDGGTIRLWDIESGNLIRAIVGHPGPIAHMVWPPNGTTLIAAGFDNRVWFWDTQNGKVVRQIQGPQGVVDSVGVSPSGKLAASVGDDRQIKIWDTGSGEMLQRGAVVSRRNTPVAWLPDSNILGQGGYGREIGYWDCSLGKATNKLKLSPGESDFFGALAFSPDGKRLACHWEKSPSTYVCDTSTGKVELNITGGDNYLVRSLAWSPDGKTLAIALNGKAFILNSQSVDKPFENNTSLGQAFSKGHPHFAESITWSPDGHSVSAVHSANRYVWLWDLGSVLAVRTLAVGTNESQAVRAVWSPDGKMLACRNLNDTRLWDPNSGKLVKTLPDPECGSSKSPLAWSPDGQVLAEVHYNPPRLLLWEPQLNNLKSTVRLGTSSLKLRPLLAWTPDDRVLAYVNNNGELSLLDVPTGKSSRPGDFMPTKAAAWSPSGTFLAFDHGDKVRLWDMEKQKVADTFEGPNAHLLWSADGAQLTGLGTDGTLTTWEVASGKVLKTHKAHSGDATDMAFSADRKTLATTHPFNVIRLWNPDTGQLRATLVALDTPWTNGMAVSPDGHYLGDPKIWREFVYVVQTEDGTQRTLTPEEFEKQYGWKNDPGQVKVTP